MRNWGYVITIHCHWSAKIIFIEIDCYMSLNVIFQSQNVSSNVWKTVNFLLDPEPEKQVINVTKNVVLDGKVKKNKWVE